MKYFDALKTQTPLSRDQLLSLRIFAEMVGFQPTVHWYAGPGSKENLSIVSSRSRLPGMFFILSLEKAVFTMPSSFVSSCDDILGGCSSELSTGRVESLGHGLSVSIMVGVKVDCWTEGEIFVVLGQGCVTGLDGFVRTGKKDFLGSRRDVELFANEENFLTASTRTRGCSTSVGCSWPSSCTTVSEQLRATFLGVEGDSLIWLKQTSII